MDSVERDKRAQKGKNERGEILYLRGLTEKQKLELETKARKEKDKNH